MSPRAVSARAWRWLGVLFLMYLLASLAHFTHNAERLAAYPNLPPWLSRTDVYAVWCALAALGLAGYLLVTRGRDTVGLLLIACYAVLGFDGLLHYRRAPFSAHTWVMNLTILTEVAAAALLLVVSIACLVRPRAPRLATA